MNSGGTDYSWEAREAQQSLVQDDLEDMTSSTMTPSPDSPASLLDDSGDSAWSSSCGLPGEWV